MEKAIVAAFSSARSAKTAMPTSMTHEDPLASKPKKVRAAAASLNHLSQSR